MAPLKKAQLLERITEALAQGGWNYVLMSDQHPFELSVFREHEILRIRVYIWNITHGGGAARSPNEYRIQITSGVSQFDAAGVDRTLVLGWWEEIGVFAAFDVSKHLGALGASPSLQIQRETLHRASADLMATQEKGNEEIAVAFAPALLGAYIEHLPDLHSIAQSPPDVRLLDEIAANPGNADPVVERASTGPRRTVLAWIARKLRDASFRDRVLTAYKNRCAFCGIQLGLLDAAHIIPVGIANNDNTSNGLALCALHHRAFDRVLVTVMPDYNVAVNPKRIDVLGRLDLTGGIQEFRDQLRQTIVEPHEASQRPDRGAIERANEIRGWKEYERVA